MGQKGQQFTSQPPILIQSPHALNPQRLLWLRDLFGSPMLPIWPRPSAWSLRCIVTASMHEDWQISRRVSGRTSCSAPTPSEMHELPALDSRPLERPMCSQ